MFTSPGWAASREDHRQEQLAKQKRIEEVQMMDLGIDSPIHVDRNAVGPLGHYTERSAEKQFTLYSYPKFFFGNDGRLQLTQVKLCPSEKEGIAYEMEDAVYRFYACPDGSYWVFHYGMWMYFYIQDIAYMNRSDGTLYTLGWKHLTTIPKAEDRKIEWPEVYPGVGLTIELCADFIKESILLTDSARAALPDPKNMGLDPNTTDIVLVYNFVRDDLCDDYKFPDYDLSESYEMADAQGVREKSDNFAIEGELTFSRKGIVRHKFLRDEALLPGYIDRDQTPELRTEVKKYIQNTQDGKTLLAYGIPYAIHQTAKEGTIVIDPTIKFQQGIYSYSGTYATQIRGDSGYTNYNYGRDTMLKVADNSSGTKWRSFVKFNLDSIDSIVGNNVSSAYLKMRFSEYTGTLVTRNASAYRILRDWNEGNSAQGETPASGEVTWNQAKFGQTPWIMAGCNGTGSDRSSTADDTCALTTTVGNWNEWEITNSMKAWLDGTANYGVIIIPDWTSSYPEFAHNSDDVSTASYRPQLVVNVNCPYSTGGANDLLEYLGDCDSESDGVVFKVNGNITTTWSAGDEVEVHWNFTTTRCEGYYGDGQFLRVYVDYNVDCDFEDSNERVLIKDLSNNVYPVIGEEEGCYKPSNNTIDSTYNIPIGVLDVNGNECIGDCDVLEDFLYHHSSIIYKFLVPDPLPVPGEIFTTVKVVLSWGEEPPSNLAYNFSWGEIESYSVTLISN